MSSENITATAHVQHLTVEVWGAAYLNQCERRQGTENNMVGGGSPAQQSAMPGARTVAVRACPLAVLI